MPTLTTLDVKAVDLRHDDVIVCDGDRTFGPVVGIGTKTKYVYLTAQDGHVARRALDATVTVQRKVDTEEEKAAQAREHAIRRLTQQMTTVLDRHAELTEATAKELVEHGLDHWDIEKLVAGQAEYRIWSEVKANLALIARRTQEAQKAGEVYEYAHVTIYDVAHDLVEEFTDRLLSVNPTSRSTSTMSNAVDDVTFAVKAKFVRDFTRYYR